jgi:predicted RNase H-like nuclease (RuvC/YqgF family)
MDFDMQEARETLDAKGESCQETEGVCDVLDTLHAAIDEIERLRARDAAMQAQIVENSKEIERLNACLTQARKAASWNEDRRIQIASENVRQAKCIEELEAARKDATERAKKAPLFGTTRSEDLDEEERYGR